MIDDDLLHAVSAYCQASTADAHFIAAVTRQAVELVTTHIGNNGGVPADIRHAAIVEVAADLWHRRATRNGIAMFGTDDIQPIRITRDPLAAARPLLAPWLGPPIG